MKIHLHDNYYCRPQNCEAIIHLSCVNFGNNNYYNNSFYLLSECSGDDGSVPLLLHLLSSSSGCCLNTSEHLASCIV